MFLVLKSSSETLQTQEERRRSTFSTLNIRFHEVGGAASARGLIRWIIAKGTQTVHSLNDSDCCLIFLDMDLLQDFRSSQKWTITSLGIAPRRRRGSRRARGPGSLTCAPRSACAAPNHVRGPGPRSREHVCPASTPAAGGSRRSCPGMVSLVPSHYPSGTGV